MTPRVVLFTSIAAFAGLAIGNLALPGFMAPPMAAAVEQQASLAPSDRIVPETKAQVQLSFAPVVKAVTPSVVNVYATTVTQASASPFAGDPFFERFFGDKSMFESRPRESQSLGSGVIVEA